MPEPVSDTISTSDAPISMANALRAILLKHGVAADEMYYEPFAM